MAAYSWKDATFAYNSQTLTAFVIDISGIKLNAVMQEFHPMGATFPTPLATGLYNEDELQVTFMYDGGGAATAPTACAVGTSSTLTLTLATGQTVSGAYIVTGGELTMGPDQDHQYVATFTPSGTITWDVAAA